MKVFVFLFLSSLGLLAGDRCKTGLSKHVFAVPTIFKFLGQSELNFCEPLAIGQKRNFDVDRSHSPTTVPHTYQLERVSDKE